MKLTRIEQKICEKYSAKHMATRIIGGQEMQVPVTSCDECPLVIDKRAMLCRANATVKDLKEYL